MSTSNVNYAKAFGIESTAAAIVFAVIYAPLVAYYIWRRLVSPTSVFLTLTLFCFLRFASFIIRAVLAGSDAAGQVEDLLIADLVIYNVGFFGMLYAAYTLVLDRQLLLRTPLASPGPLKILTLISRNRMFIRATLTAAVVLGIVGITDTTSSSASDISTGITLRRASIYIFLVITILFVIETFSLAVAEFSAYDRNDTNSLLHEWYIVTALCAISVFLLVREAFLAATSNRVQQYNEHFWYPLAVLPEYLAVLLFAIPGLVPARNDVPKSVPMTEF